ncbi:adenosylmethionine--8-amino-7-oxononanoate transaminase [Psychromonas sp. 14N.309.X.WAT.B.A12]|uniref:adenosylmethionine--8-amino-7-oxononanoate transaminase n=1 Tax=unclassified Psychromonas TaxID=2614957 RepID=UPI0025AEE0D3|nr:adenosylmethionine--8-amino-7-oxononanoate transaminase [Psychromonas sp. 14N.309.X.WAT.B.A12]MDN2662146.1 adenosylmethionine--8-amino-7-oxononanoate transaminase [Psychromonas sp. 14N.309.X.WAT.B.A12]
MNNKVFSSTSIDLNFDKDHIWHPYTSMTDPIPCYPVQSANGCLITLESGNQLIDGMSSWWACLFGYNVQELNQAATQQLDKMSHIMFGGLTHQPATNLAKTLVEITPKGLDKVFFSDSGSVAVEVAMKMALQYWQSLGKYKTKFIALKKGYHGDTFAAMSVTDPDGSMHELYQDFVAKNYFTKQPSISFDQVWDEEEMHELRTLLAENHQHVAALILEPIVQGAGGMHFYHPNYLKAARALCDQYDVLLIADEIATGFGRTGKLFACEHAQISPDILCLGKAITGGYMSFAATLTTDTVAHTISRGKAGVFMHGPTFMGNPLACAVANANLALLMSCDWSNLVETISKHLSQQLTRCEQLPSVKNVRVLGAIGVVEMHQAVEMVTIQKQFVDAGVWIRPFGKLIYIMPPYVITAAQLNKLCEAIYNICEQIK